MKILIIAMAVSFLSGVATADTVKCNYSKTPCNEYGDHFICMSTFIGLFCSPNDESGGSAQFATSMTPDGEQLDGVSCAYCVGLQGQWGYQACTQLYCR